EAREAARRPPLVGRPIEEVAARGHDVTARPQRRRHRLIARRRAVARRRSNTLIARPAEIVDRDRDADDEERQHQKKITQTMAHDRDPIAKTAISIAACFEAIAWRTSPSRGH